MYPESRVRRARLVLSPWPSTEYSCCSRAAAEESSSTVKLSQEGSVSACLHRGARGPQHHCRWYLLSPEVCQELDNLLARGHHGDEDAILLQPGAGDVGDGHLHGDMARSEVTLPGY